MSFDPRTPVVIGVGVASQRFEDANQGKEACELMAEAVQGAAADCGNAAIVCDAGVIGVPKGLWSYGDAGRLVAEAIGANEAQTLLADIGVLQQTLFNIACIDIAEGQQDIVIVTGGEAKFRNLRAQIAGIELQERESSAVPDRLLKPQDELWSQLEWDNGLGMPVTFYSVMENALRYAEGIDIATHRDQIAQLWAVYNQVAQHNADAWNRDPYTVAQIRNAGEDNKMLAFPYTKRHNSNWSVDQAAALIFCSVETAERYNIPREKWVFPWSGTESNHMVSVCKRKELHRCPGAEVSAAVALELAQIGVDELDFVDLYSCFPLAPRIYARALGLSPDRSPTFTGGMSFAGGPLNNYVLQAAVKLVELLRSKPASKGLISSVSGMLTKQGFGIWGSEPSANGFQFADVSEQVDDVTDVCELLEDYTGEATIAGYTVIFQHNTAQRGVVICNLPNGLRTVAHSDDAALAQRMTEEEFCGKTVDIDAAHVFQPR